MAQSACCFCLPFETFDKPAVGHILRHYHFERDRPLCAKMCGEIDGAHPALPKLSFDSIFLVEYMNYKIQQLRHFTTPFFYSALFNFCTFLCFLLFSFLL